MKNCIIIHGASFRDKEKLAQGLPPQNERSWLPWIKKELEQKNISCFTPLMPKNWKPNYPDWKKEFEKLTVNKESILVGHSMGGAFLTRWLGEHQTKIKKLILVAPAKISPNHYNDYFRKFLDFKINTKIKNLTKNITIFISNDEKKIVESTKLYHETLEGTIIELTKKGHFIEKHMGTKKFPELLKEILKSP